MVDDTDQPKSITLWDVAAKEWITFTADPHGVIWFDRVGTFLILKDQPIAHIRIVGDDTILSFAD